MDTVGEFVRGVWNRGFLFPEGTNLPKFRPNDSRPEFANSIRCYRNPTIAQTNRTCC